MAFIYPSSATIELDVDNSATRLELTVAGENIKPGYLVARALDLYHCEPHRVSVSVVKPAPATMFAIENLTWGKEITDTYYVGERAFIRHCRKGDIILAMVIKDKTYTFGMPLVTSGTGTAETYGMLAPAATDDFHETIAISLGERSSINNGLVKVEII